MDFPMTAKLVRKGSHDRQHISKLGSRGGIVSGIRCLGLRPSRMLLSGGRSPLRFYRLS
jgi:hypothetical protein